jgi:hypothetical protein
MRTLDDGRRGRIAPGEPGRSESPGTGSASADRPGAELVDAALLQEISLLADVITSLGGVKGHLTLDQVDAVLGVASDGGPRTAPAERHTPPATA